MPIYIEFGWFYVLYEWCSVVYNLLNNRGPANIDEPSREQDARRMPIQYFTNKISYGEYHVSVHFNRNRVQFKSYSIFGIPKMLVHFSFQGIWWHYTNRYNTRCPPKLKIVPRPLQVLQ